MSNIKRILFFVSIVSTNAGLIYSAAISENAVKIKRSELFEYAKSGDFEMLKKALSGEIDYEIVWNSGTYMFFMS